MHSLEIILHLAIYFFSFVTFRYLHQIHARLNNLDKLATVLQDLVKELNKFTYTGREDEGGNVGHHIVACDTCAKYIYIAIRDKNSQ